MIVVSDAGPLIHLAAIGRLDLLKSFSTEVLIPDAVFEEVAVLGTGLPGADEVRSASWLIVASPTASAVVDALIASGLHRGEAQAIALAVERRADWLAIDERDGRKTAEAMGLRIIGTLGILVAARQRGEIAELRPLLADLRRSGFWLSDAVVSRVLSSVGEAGEP